MSIESIRARDSLWGPTSSLMTRDPIEVGCVLDRRLLLAVADAAAVLVKHEHPGGPLECTDPDCWVRPVETALAALEAAP